jgi:hypothetical protein
MNSPEDQLFLLRSQVARERRDFEETITEFEGILRDIWKERGLSQKLWARIAECLEEPEEDIPISYDPTPITASDLLKLQRRVAKLERAAFGEVTQTVPVME